MQPCNIGMISCVLIMCVRVVSEVMSQHSLSTITYEYVTGTTDSGVTSAAHNNWDNRHSCLAHLLLLSLLPIVSDMLQKR